MTLTAQQVTLGPGRISEVKANHTGIYWIEQRPSEKGRSVLMHWSGEGKPVYISPEGMNVGSRINEYGGGSYYLDEDQVYYPPSSKLGDATYADNRFIYVRETSDSQSLVEVSLTGEITKTIHDKHDFYAAPRLNPQTNELAFIAWDLPSMPWDHTHLYTMDLTTECPPPFKGAAEYSRRGFFAGGLPSFKSQPTWHNGELYFISDHQNFGQLYHYHENRLEPVCENWPNNADAAMPLWLLGMQTFLPIDDHRFAIIYSQEGWYHLGIIDHGQLRELDLPFCAYGDQIALWENHLAFSAATPTEGFAVRLLDLRTGTYQTISDIAAPLLTQDEISVPEPITFPTSNDEVAHAFFYRPKNPNPPLLVMSHGGPTFYTNAGYSNKIQFWTQNGFAVVDVNYRGSTGFGRHYWEALKHAWGDADAKDCIAAAEYVVKQGWVNPDQLFIRGSSAGGFLSLCAMATSDIFKAGAIYYGVSDLNAFMTQTHRFESGYNDWLVGKTVKSPVDQLEKYQKPIIFFHGLKDTVVPVSHSEVIFEALRKNNIETQLHTYPEEGHSFRGASTVIDSLTKELAFFKQFL